MNQLKKKKTAAPYCLFSGMEKQKAISVISLWPPIIKRDSQITMHMQPVVVCDMLLQGFMGFGWASEAFFIFNTGSSDLVKPDPSTQQLNRYEIGLFDIENPSNKNDIDRLEELYLSYSWKKNSVVLGKQIINTPFINPQDGRMRPTGVEGIWLKTKTSAVKIDGGLLWGISPRSTVRWFNIGQSIGIYPQGVNESGKPSDYKEHISSNFIGIIGISYPVSSRLKIQLWEQLTQQVSNTILLQADQQFGENKEEHYYAAVQTIIQHSIKNGGNHDPAHTYMPKGNSAVSFGARLGWKEKHQDISFNYTRITRQGRYLMPREWGRDPFFTFLPRERNEGFGDLHAWMLQYKKQFGERWVSVTYRYGLLSIARCAEYPTQQIWHAILYPIEY